MPQSLSKAESHLLDITYDGSVNESDVDSGGLGQLVDGITPNYTSDKESDATRHDYLLVGWHRDAHAPTSTVNLLFQFEQIHNYSALIINCHTDQKHNIGSFSRALVWFSLDNEHWCHTPIRFEYQQHQSDSLIQFYRGKEWIRLSLWCC